MIKFNTAARQTVIGIVACSLAASAAPAMAAETNGKQEASAATLVPAASASAARVQPKKYCIVEAATGTRMPRKSCKTEREWLDVGVDLSKR